MRNSLSVFVVVLLCVGCRSASTPAPRPAANASATTGAQTSESRQPATGVPNASVPAGTQPPAGAPPGAQARGPRPYREVITAAAKSDSGLFVVHVVGERWYYEIPKTLLEREMLLVSRIAKTAASVGYGGEESASSVVRWQQVGNRVLLRYATFGSRAADSLPISLAIRASNFEPILQSFDVAAFSPDSSALVVEVGPLFVRDIPLLGIDQNARTAFQVRRLDDTRTLVNSIRSFPRNIEVRNTLTYDAGRPPSNAVTSTLSVEMNHSMLLLPEKPMRGRFADPRIGYFATEFTDFGNAGQAVETKGLISRWRLEPKDTAAFLRGELTDPIKPITFYIDPATPKKWYPYLKSGVAAWSKVFEAAGFRNAVVAKDPPTPAEDPEFSLEDSRYSVIRYFASTEENAYGPRIVDPRSGEILEAHIGWYHNATNIFSQLYRLQVGAIDARAFQRELPEELVGNLVRYVVAHEVGHSIGLRHSHGVSAAIPVDSLRSRVYMEKLGTTTPSIMDYARWNYVAQPGDGVTVLSPWFGPYDSYAINWGYRPLLGVASAEAESVELDRLIREKADDPMYRWINDEVAFSGIDPTAMNEALGDNAARASRYGIANLRRAASRMVEFTAAPRENYGRLQDTQNYLQLQWNWLVGHVVGMVGGRIMNVRYSDQTGPQWTVVPRDRQIEAMRFLNDEVWTAPEWLADAGRMDRIEHAGFTERIRRMQLAHLSGLLDLGRLQRLIEAEQRYGAKTYTLSAMLGDLRKDIFTELSSTTPTISLYRRELQRGYVERMRQLLTTEQPAAPPTLLRTNVSAIHSDIRPLARAELEALSARVVVGIGATRDAMTRAHLRDLQVRIRDILDPRK